MAPADSGTSSDRPLGCSRCRWSRKGCSRCRNPQFRPRTSPSAEAGARRSLATRLAAAAVRSSTARLAVVQDRRLRTGGWRGGSGSDETLAGAPAAGPGAKRLSPVRVPSPVWPDLPKAPVTPPSSPDSSLGSFGSSVLAELQAFAAERDRDGERGDAVDQGGAAGDGREEEGPGGAAGDGREEEDRGGATGDGREEEDRGGATGEGREEEGPGGAAGDGREEENRGGDGAHTPPARLADNLSALRLAGMRRGHEAVAGEAGGTAGGGAEGASDGGLRERGPKRAKLERANQSGGAERGAENGAAAGDGPAIARSDELRGTSDAVEPIGPAGAMTGRGDPNPRQTKHPRLSFAAGEGEDDGVKGRVATVGMGDAVGPSGAHAVHEAELRRRRRGDVDERSFARNPPPGIEPLACTFPSSSASAPGALSQNSALAPGALSPGRGSTPSQPTTPARKRRQPRREDEEDQVVGAEPPVRGGVGDAAPGRSPAARPRAPRVDRPSPPPSKRRRALPSSVAGARVSRWTPPASPWGLVEEELWRDPWRLLVACVLLNKTRGDAARRVLAALFRAWPTAEALAGIEAPGEEPMPHNEALTLSRLAGLLQPLGLHRRRAASLLAMSRAYLQGDWVEARDLPGVGPYADDAFRIFCLGEWRETIPQDKDLKRYRDFLVETDGQGLGLQPPPEYWGGLGGGADASRDAPTKGDAADAMQE